MKEVEKLVVTYEDGKIEIMGNRAGLKFLGEVCLGLSELTDKEAKTAANHYHFEEGMDSASQEGSIPMMVTLSLKL
jgi:hypothetical protein